WTRARETLLMLVPALAAVVAVDPLADSLLVDGAPGQLLGAGDGHLGRRRARRHDPPVGAVVRDAVAVGLVPAEQGEVAVLADEGLHLARRQVPGQLLSGAPDFVGAL